MLTGRALMGIFCAAAPAVCAAQDALDRFYLDACAQCHQAGYEGTTAYPNLKDVVRQRDVDYFLFRLNNGRSYMQLSREELEETRLRQLYARIKTAAEAEDEARASAQAGDFRTLGSKAQCDALKSRMQSPPPADWTPPGHSKCDGNRRKDRPWRPRDPDCKPWPSPWLVADFDHLCTPRLYSQGATHVAGSVPKISAPIVQSHGVNTVTGTLGAGTVAGLETKPFKLGQQDRQRLLQQTCADRAQGRLRWDYQGSRQWSDNNLVTLCTGAENSVEPGRCFEIAMHGATNHGKGERWVWQDALRLCAGTSDHEATLSCFRQQIRDGADQQAAIDRCKRR